MTLRYFCTHCGKTKMGDDDVDLRGPHPGCFDGWGHWQLEPDFPVIERLQAQNAQLLEVAHRLVNLKYSDGGRGYPSEEDIEAARAAIAAAEGDA